ncbi:TEX2 family protein [Megaselia abdita]
MDSLKLPQKGSTNNSSTNSASAPKSGSIPITVRFNANEESLDDIILQSFHTAGGGGGGDSLSSSPSGPPQTSPFQSQTSEDQRNNFLQQNFFNRKSSSSTENISVSSIIPQLSTPDTSGGTWKMIKGKVSQAMEDIKSSKSPTVLTVKSDIPHTTYYDSDVETVNSEIGQDSDSDVDSNIFNDEESSAIKKSLAHLKSKVTKKDQIPKNVLQTSNRQPLPKKDSSLRNAFLRKRNRKMEEEREKKPLKPSTIKKDIEIESGVEMLEDMVVIASAVIGDIPELKIHDSPKEENLPQLTRQISIPKTLNIETNKTDKYSRDIFTQTTKKIIFHPQFISNSCLLAILSIAPIPEFFRGIIACLFFLSIISIVSYHINRIFEAKVTANGPEKTEFHIPDYTSMPVCEIPVVEEHKTVKTYRGWMNEINNYDPNNYHISMTRSVYIKLEGSSLRIANTTARVPKREMWNEVPTDVNKLIFTNVRVYNLLGSKIEMLPRGLARKRYFGRKYPIQLIIKNNNNARNSVDQQNVPTETFHSDSGFVELSLPKPEKPKKMSAGKIDVLLGDCDISESSKKSDNDNVMDFGTVVLNSDPQSLQTTPILESEEPTIPCGDETRILLFARGDRDKEDWYRRFLAASQGQVEDQDIHLPNVTFIDDSDIKAAAKAATFMPDNEKLNSSPSKTPEDISEEGDSVKKSEMNKEASVETPSSTTFEGLIISNCAGRNSEDYIKFMALYQSRREKRQKDELWRGIDQSLFLGPCGSVVWANVLVGRILYSCLNDALLQSKIQEFLQKKLSAIRLPGFMEDVSIKQIYLGETPPIIHRVSQPVLDERGTWIDADLTYEGLMHMTITTKLNLLRLKRQHSRNNMESAGTPSNEFAQTFDDVSSVLDPSFANCAIYDSNAESSGASSSESESPNLTSVDTSSDQHANNPGNARKIFKIVDRITASNIFQYATELSYVQKAMENMSTNITLRVHLKGLVSRVAINIPPPPSDRIWLSFRGPPRLWISAKPAVGDHTFDWSMITNVIESKLCDEVYKYLVYPNMVDIIVPFLGQSTYKE